MIPAEVGAPSHRAIRLPSLLRVVRGTAATSAAILDSGLQTRAILVVHSGAASGTGYGAAVAGRMGLDGSLVTQLVVTGPPATAVGAVSGAIDLARPDLVVGVGGGLVTDVAKLASARVDVPFVCVPTQASSDGMCSPVAVIPGPDGRPQSLGARIPSGVVVDMEVLGRAPRMTWLSGLGDLVSNLSAVRDWRWAHRQFGEPVDDFACLTAEAAALAMIEEAVDIDDPEYREKLVRSLILSGVAMEMAGSSRPASGTEHLISHALDATSPVRRLHGLQVALATPLAYVLRGESAADLLGFYRSVGLPVVPAELGLSVDDVVAAARQGPATRPGRRTILDTFDADAEARLRAFFAGEGG
jgi:glycerol-1-phosphate dehydrogenase [NAD(P)+]